MRYTRLIGVAIPPAIEVTNRSRIGDTPANAIPTPVRVAGGHSKAEPRLAQQVADVVDRAGHEVVEAQHLRPVFQQALAEMEPRKAAPPVTNTRSRMHRPHWM
jgi:hypothetical protein